MGTASGNPTWENLPAQTTPLSAQALNNIESALDSTQLVADQALSEVTTRLTDAALQGLFPVYRVWNGTAYPPRIPGALNIFFGPTDPGLLMQEQDYWALPDVTTLGAVTAAVLDPSTPLFDALSTISGGNTVEIPMAPRSGDTIPFSSPAGVEGLFGYAMGPDTTTVVAGVVPAPYGWGSARVRINYYVPAETPSGAVRITRAAAAYRTGTSPVVASRISNTIPSTTAGQVGSYLITGEIDLATRTHVSAYVERTGSSSLDTLTSSLYCLSVQLERTS